MIEAEASVFHHSVSWSTLGPVASAGAVVSCAASPPASGFVS
jgi:hypothetical protein